MHGQMEKGAKEDAEGTYTREPRVRVWRSLSRECERERENSEGLFDMLTLLVACSAYYWHVRSA